MDTPAHNIHRNISSLRLIFWGGIVCILDLSINNFDIFNDFIGTVMIACGVFEMAAIKVHKRYSKAMLFVKIMSVLACLETLQGYFLHEYSSSLFSVILILIRIAELVAIIVFCVAMRWLSIQINLHVSETSWKITTLLFAAIYLVPLGLLYLGGILTIILGNQFNLNLELIGLLLIPLFFVPLIHFFISTSRMKNEAQAI